MEKTVIDKLTVDMQTLCTLPRWQVDGAIVGLGKTIAPKNGREKLFIRCPWSEIPEDYYKQCNFHFTITPDRHKFIEDPHSLEYKKKTISLLINMIINEESIERAVTVYEWGRREHHMVPSTFIFYLKRLKEMLYLIRSMICLIADRSIRI